MRVSSGLSGFLGGIGRATLLALLLIPPAAQAQPGTSDTQTVSGIHFPTSCDEAVQAQFDHAVEQLHSFEYPASEKAFRSVLKTDPGCGMARWGVAMTQWHPLWAPPGKTELELGAAMMAAVDRSNLSPRESGFVDALRLFFSSVDGTTHQERALAHSQAMEALYRSHPEDPEVVAFYALSLLATVDPADKTYCTQYRSAGLLNWLLQEHPLHPGGLHYLIHSYDYPGLAHLALRAADVYAGAAPDSAHAQHMPSHIFTRLGLWDRSIASNRDSTTSAAEYTERAQLPGHYDEGIHSIDYLVYAHLQVAADEQAKRVVDGLRGLGKAHPENFKVAYAYAASPARYALERQAWSEASRLTLSPQDFPWAQFRWAESIHHFARGIGAARSGDIGLARQALQSIEGIARGLPPETLKYWREEVEVHADAVKAWIALAEGEVDAALQLAESAADREDAVDKHPVTPGEVLPARELFADMLLGLGRADDARNQYGIVLQSSPNRLNALLGAAEASVRLEDREKAAGYYRAALRQTADGEQDRPRLRTARAYFSK